MASPLQVEANRRNSLHSTGPRTPEGKAVSRFNALKSGIHAEAQIIPGEDPAELEALSAGYYEQFHPASPIQCFLVDTLVHADWQLRRMRRLEAQLWTSQLSEIKEDAPLGRAYVQSLDAFTRLQRRIDATERSYYRALKQLLEVASAISSPADPEPIETPPLPPDLASFRQPVAPAILSPASALSASPPYPESPDPPQPDMLIR